MSMSVFFRLTNTQNYNKYSYVLNNPLKHTDPSGYRSQKVYKLTPPDVDGVNHALNMDREAHWAAMHSGGDELNAFFAVLFGGSGTGGGGGDASGAPNGGSAAGDGGPDGCGDGNPTITNNSSQPIMVKPEDGSDYVILQPGESYYGQIDGFTIPFAEGLEVYKVVSTFNDEWWEVTDTRVDIFGDPTGAKQNLNELRGGEVTPLWIINDLKSRDPKYIPEPTLGGWRPLFDFNYYNY